MYGELSNISIENWKEIMDKELSGYDIKIVFEEVFTHFFDGSFGMIYPTLRQLEK